MRPSGGSWPTQPSAMCFSMTDDPTGEALLRHGGLIVLGMGKLGAEELNYSSDIDLIVLFDPEKIEAKRPDRLQHEMVRPTRAD